ncbi:MAG: ferredoxin [Candidatus Gastranaerophilales bacterium]|nr:ferredoxin [Candidatus Gastranaerophilales bacterium]
MKVTILDGCICCGACESICSDVFSIEDTAIVNEAAVAANADAVREAADACPVSVIEIEE